MTASQKSAVYKDVEEISKDDCLKIARLKMKCTDVEVENVTMKTLGDTPAGFGGDHYRLTITARKKSSSLVDVNDSELVDLHFFVKTKPRDQAHSDFIEGMGVIRRELDFFSTLMVLFKGYVCDEEDSSVNMQVPWTADCFLANMKLIVLTDLTYENYSLLENRSAMNYDHCAVMFEAVARFHASTIIFEEKASQKSGTAYRVNKVYPEMFKENTWSYDPPGNSGKKISEAGINGLLSLIKIMPELKADPKKFEIVQNSMLNLFKDMNKLVEVSTDVRNVATHGDLWANNVMFQYDSTGGKPVAARIIDFQLLRYTAPAHDFMCALYLNTTRGFRDKHFLALASVYHTALAAELTRFKLDVDKLMPWSEFKSSLEHYRMLGLLTACAYYPSTLMPDDIASVVFGDPEKLNKFMIDDQSEWTCLGFETDALFRERISEVIDELADHVTKLRD